jgi:hypothetical protein
MLLGILIATPLAHATDDEGINLTNFPQALADYFGISLFAAGILASIILFMFVIMPLLVFTKGRNLLLNILAGVATLGFTTSVGWFPPWIFAVIILFVAAMWGSKLGDKI